MKKIIEKLTREEAALNKKLPLNKKILYMTIIIMIAFIVVLSTSFAFIQKQVTGAEVNLKVGELEYTIESSDLTNNQITLLPSSNKILEIKLTSNNSIDSKYEFFYKIVSPEDTEGITGGYLVSSIDLPYGTIKSNEEKNVKLMLNNSTAQELTIEVGLKAGFVYNELVLSENEYSLTKEINSTTITYVTDTDTQYQEQIIIGETALSPTTFIPEKSGWTFLGWKEDTEASSEVLTSKIADGTETTLYAVYEQPITLSYNGNGSTSGTTASQSDARYYNASGNYNNPTFVLSSNGFTKTNYTFSKWAINSTSGSQYAAGSSITLTADTTFYAIWTFTSIRAYTFNKTSNYCENVSNVYNDAFIRFEKSGYVGSNMSIGYDDNGRGIRLIPSRSGTLRFYLKAYNQTGANLTSNCTIYINDVRYKNTIGANSSLIVTKDLNVTSGQIINIGNDGQNGYMYITSGSYIDWIS